MEVYNTLAQEFHDRNTPRNHLIQYKRIADELTHTRLVKKMQLISKRKQLEQSQQLTHQMSDSRLSVISTGSVKEIGGARWEMESMERTDLKKKIGQIQKQIENINSKTHQINDQLSLFVNKQQQTEVAVKKAELTMFNALQQLSIATSQQKEQEQKQQHLLQQLTYKRNKLASHIKQLLEQKQNNRERLLRLQMDVKTNKELKMKTLLEIGDNMTHLRDTIRNMVGLHHLYQRKEQRYVHLRSNSSISEQTKQIIESIMKDASKYDLLEHLSNLGYQFDEAFSLRLASFYSELETEFDRNQSTNQYLNNHLTSLNTKYDQLLTIIQSANKNTQKQTQEQLTQTQFSLNQKQEVLQSKCKVISLFTIKYYFLLNKLVSLRKTVHNILGQKVLAEQLAKVQKSESVLKQYGHLMGRNPQDSKVGWNQVVGISSFYNKIIDPNDLLRLFSSPSIYKSDQDELKNFELLMNHSFRLASDFISSMSRQVASYFRSYPCPARVKSIVSWTFLNNVPESGNLCIESKEYYRRDDYKLLDKLNKIELKKKGLLANIPFNVSIDNEVDSFLIQEQGSTEVCSPRLSCSRKHIKYTNLATKREENTMKQTSVRKLFNRLNSLDNKPQSSRIINLQSMRQTMRASRFQLASLAKSKNIKSTTRRLRHTTGILQKENK